jgi:murein DD-endopeptidase MepM/ murein hydrolase activator NlpD
MPRHSRRALAIVAVTLAATSLVAATAPRAEAAMISGTAPAAAEPTFLIEAFPNQSDDVEFFDSWGARRPGGRRHKGIDIHSPKGSPVVAVADGFVIARKWHRDSGFYLKIAHADGWVSSYVHLNNDRPGTDDGEGGESAAFAPGIEVGTFVRAGDLIGYVGDSGNAEGTVSHTHFSLELDGTKLNPYPLLLAALPPEPALPEVPLLPLLPSP